VIGVMTRRWDEDEELLDDLAAAMRDVDPTAQRVAAAAEGLYSWRTVDQELFLASLSFDSSAHATSPVRGDAGDARVLVFDAAPLSVELEVTADRITGQIIPPSPGEIVVEADGGPPVRLTADEHGFFVVTGLPTGRIRVRCDTTTSRVVTDWVVL
jgi:hypothetical protein